MRSGVCYYPEHWPREQWAEDARWLKELGVSIVRMAEFAWSRLEPAQGQFEFGWLDEAVELFARDGFEIVLGTPTAAPPRWLSFADPSTLPVDEEGRRRRPGGRHHVCPTSPAFREHARRIVTAMAERYARHDAVIGWQVDNELGESDSTCCYCSLCTAGFADWLRERHGTLDALNDAWGTVFWSAELSDWAQVEPPILQRNKPNPAAVLDHRRYQSAVWTDFLRFQAGLLREHLPEGRFVTHNFMGLFPDVDAFELAGPLDLATWDSYPAGHAARYGPEVDGGDPPDAAYAFDVGDPAITGLSHDLTYGLRRAPFWVMEQGMGHVNWGAENVLARPGTPRLWCWHAAASGADAVVFFRERAARYAQEQYHSGLQHHDGTPDVGYVDAARLHEEREALERVTASPVEADVALLFSYADLWALELNPHHRAFTYLRSLLAWYRALMRLGVQVAVVPHDGDLDGFRVALAPTLHLAKAETAARLEAFAARGGSVVLGVRSGMKTPANAVADSPLPGLLRDLAGVTVTDWGALPAGLGWPLGSDRIAALDGTHTRLWIEALRPDAPATEVLAEHTEGPYAGRAALTEHALGAGRVLTCGWHPTVDQAAAILDRVLASAGVRRLADDLPPGLVARRRGTQLVLLNFTDAPLDAVVGATRVPVAPRDIAVLGGDANG